MQVLRPGVVEQSLLRVQLRQFQGRIHARLQLGDLLVHGDAFDREPLRGVGVAHLLEAFDGFAAVPQPGIKVANRVVYRQIAAVVLENLFVF